MIYPIADLHCDLTSYLLRPNSSIFNTDDIGCSLEHLRCGNVNFQVLAFYTGTEQGSTKAGIAQADVFNTLVQGKHFQQYSSTNDFETAKTDTKILVLPAIENASGFCEEHEPLQKGLERLEHIIETTGKLAYIGITHHPENRFGGGNKTTIGLKKDGMALLDYISERQIPIDFAHTSDQLAEDILNYITKQNLPIKILASHSNFRALMNVQRNLPNEFVQEIIHRNGVIGMNFLKPYIHETEPSVLLEHFRYGMSFEGGEELVAIGADYFYTKDYPAERLPFYFEEHETASCYQPVMKQLEEFYTQQQVENIAYNNVANFYMRVFE